MIKKDIKYTDFNGKEQTETFYFHLNEFELTELDAKEDGEGFADTIKHISKTEDRAEIIRMFKILILNSVGKKSADGTRFEKSEEIRKDFEQSAAFPALFMEMLGDANVAAAFVNGIIPQKLADKAKQLQQN